MFRCVLLLAYKCAGDGLINVINLTSFLRHQDKRAELVCSLQWTQTDTQYINLIAANGIYVVQLLFLYSNCHIQSDFNSFMLYS